MEQQLKVRYETARGSIEFSRADMQFWISSFEQASGMPIEMNGVQSLGQVGASLSNQVIGARSITVNGYIFDPIAENRRRLIDIFAPKVAGRFTVMDGNEAFYLDVYPEQTPEFADSPHIQAFQLKLFAPYPFWQSVQRVNHQLAGLDARFSFPFYTGGTWLLSEYTEGFFNNVRNDGNVEVEPIITFHARQGVVNPELLHVDTGKVIRLETTLQAGERVIVDTRQGRKSAVHISANGVETNAFRLLSLDSDLGLALLPGVNRLRFDARSNRMNLNILLDAPRGVKSGV